MEKFEFRPNAILKSTSQHLLRFRQELKRSNQPFTQMKLQQIIYEFEHEEAGLFNKNSEIKSAFYKMKEEERLIRSNLKIEYIPNKGYLDRYKYSWRECKCGERWNFHHLEMHDPQLKKEFDEFEDELNSYLLSGSQIYLLQFYQDYVCEKIHTLNMRMHVLVESEAFFYVNKQKQNLS